MHGAHQKLRDNGLTLIFVSHDLSTLQLVCDRAIWIHKGMLKEAGDPVQVAQEYYALTANNKPEGSHANSKSIPQQNTGMGIFIKAEMLRSQEESLENYYHPGSNVRIMFTMQTLQRIEQCIFNISIFSNDGIWMVGQSSLEQGVIWPATEAGNCLSGMIELANLCLAPGNYKAALSACSVDLSICYALSDLYLSFSVRSDRPTWGECANPAIGRSTTKIK